MIHVENLTQPVVEAQTEPEAKLRNTQVTFKDGTKIERTNVRTYIRTGIYFIRRDVGDGLTGVEGFPLDNILGFDEIGEA